jgi:hypothetical protein
MSSYISLENQTLLWNVISKNKEVYDYFTRFPGKKEPLFKSIIQSLYEENKQRFLNQNELIELNKKTISFMIQTIRNEVGREQSLQKQNDPSFLKPYSITEHKVEKIGNQFQEKQAEYNTLFDKKVPETPEFSEKQDKPLSNMDELIKQHLKEREEELRMYTPLPLVQPVQSNVKQSNVKQSNVKQSNSVQPNATNKLKIESLADTINIHIEEIVESSNQFTDPKPKKSVNWLDDSTTEKFETQQQEIELLKTQILELIKKVTILEGIIEQK